jgi:hypothetical protein
MYLVITLDEFCSAKRVLLRLHQRSWKLVCSTRREYEQRARLQAGLGLAPVAVWSPRHRPAALSRKKRDANKSKITK